VGFVALMGVQIGDAVSQAIGGPGVMDAVSKLRAHLSDDGTVDGKGTPTSLAMWVRQQSSGPLADTAGMDDTLQRALGSKPIVDAILHGDAQGLSNVAQAAAENHWTRQAQEYADLSRLVQSGQITTEGQVQLFLQNGANYAAYLAASLRDAPRVALPGATGQQIDTGGAPIFIDTGGQRDRPSPRFAAGGWLDRPTDIVAGDAPGGEAVLNRPEITQLLAAAVAGAQGGRGDTVVNVYNPTSEVDMLLALQRADYHNNLVNVRGVYPARQWPADLALRPS
jgi:hypothetical protein